MIKQTFGSLATATLGFITFAGAIGSIAIYGANLKNDFESAKGRVIQLETQVAGLREQLAAKGSTPAAGPQGPAGPPGPKGDPGPAADTARLDRIEDQLARLAADLSTPAAAGGTSPEPMVNDLMTDRGLSGVARDGTGASWPFTIRSVRFDTASEFSAEIAWPTLDSVNRIRGAAEAARLRFTETGYVKRGKAPIGCEYSLDAISAGKFAGTFTKCGGSPDVVGEVTAGIGG